MVDILGDVCRFLCAGILHRRADCRNSILFLAEGNYFAARTRANDRAQILLTRQSISIFSVSSSFGACCHSRIMDQRSSIIESFARTFSSINRQLMRPSTKWPKRPKSLCPMSSRRPNKFEYYFYFDLSIAFRPFEYSSLQRDFTIAALLQLLKLY